MSHYFETPTGEDDDRGRVSLVLGDATAELSTGRGVFSRGRIDPGTALLLKLVPPPPARGHVLDLGCGYGAIALSLAARAPQATVWAIDVNERARTLCAGNAVAAGFGDRVRVAAPADVPAKIRFAAIWSNPPIRIGKAAMHDLLTQWLRRLDDGGLAHLVVSRHLGAESLHRWLADQGWEVDRVASRKSYRLLAVGPRVAGSRR